MTSPTITQADREAAASVAALVEMRELILAGKADHHAEPFARHREAALIEGARMALDAATLEVEMRWGHIATPELRDAIRNLSPKLS